MKLFLGLLLAAKLPFEYLVAPSVAENTRNSEADTVILRDGRVLLAWIDFYGGGTDWAGARISARISKNRGETWGDKFTLQENIGAMNVMEPDLLRLKSGKILFLFCRKNSPADCAPMVRVSRDDARTFTPPKPMAIAPSPSYTGFNHDRAIQLKKSGRILMPLFYTTDYRVDPRIRSRVYYSDDEGESWKPSETILDLPSTKHGAQEPGVIELKDGRILLWVRTELGRIYKSYSSDQGVTWSALEPMDIESPLSPQSLKRHPKTGDLIMTWNNTRGPRRWPLTAAVSKDEGLTWTHVKNLDETPNSTFAYTSIEWLPDRALLTYYVEEHPRVQEPRWSLKLKAVPLDWFYK